MQCDRCCHSAGHKCCLGKPVGLKRLVRNNYNNLGEQQFTKAINANWARECQIIKCVKEVVSARFGEY